MDISSRHLPNLSHTSPASNIFDESSFQIPTSTPLASNLLQEDSFLHGINQSLATPAPPAGKSSPRRIFQRPLPVDELTPRSKRTRIPTMKPRPHISPPPKPRVAHDLSIALEEALSPLKHNTTFSIPTTSSVMGDLISTEVSSFLQAGNTNITFTNDSVIVPITREPLTFSQLTTPLVAASPRRVRRSSTTTPEALSVPAGLEGLSLEDPGNLDPVQRVEETEAISLSEADPAPEAEKQPLDDTSLLATISASEAPTSASLSIPITNVDRGFELSEVGDNASGPTKEDCVIGEIPRPKGRITKNKRTVIDGGISKRTTAKLPDSFAGNPSKAGRKLSSATLESRSTTDGSLQLHRPGRATSRPVPEHAIQAHTTSNDIVAAGGLAAALISYGQKNAAVTGPDHGAEVQKVAGSLTPSSAIVPGPELPRNAFKAEPVQSSTPPEPADIDRDADGTHNCASTLQQLVPDGTSGLSSCQADTLPEILGYHPESHPDPAFSAAPPSPMRPAVKRRSSPVPSSLDELEEPRRKKGKDASNEFPCAAPRLRHPARSKPTARNLKSSQSSRVNRKGVTGTKVTLRSVRSPVEGRDSLKHSNLSSSGDTSSSNPSDGTSRTRTAAATLRDAPLQHGEPRYFTASGSGGLIHDQSLDPVPSTSSTAGRSGDFLPDPLPAGNDTRRLPSSRSLNHSVGSNEQHTASLTRPVRKPSADKETQKPTKPFDFTFTFDTRLWGPAPSKGLDEFKRSLKANGLLHIPDYKKLHAANEKELTERKKESVVPIVPLPSKEFHTDTRAHERERFDEGLRSKQKEAERLTEERRKLKELEEEREIKELRRRAVPKANELPDWYQFAPKRSVVVHKEENGGAVAAATAAATATEVEVIEK